MRVLMFARVRDLIGAAYVDVDDVATVGELRRRLIERHPQMAGLIEKCAVAVDDEFAGDDVAISAGAEVALLPPVSGG